MNNRKVINIFMSFMFIVSLLFGNGQVNAQTGDPPPPKQDKVKITQKDRQDAAARSLQQGALNPLMVDAQAAPLAADLIDGTPHYFSHPNYANSPLPSIEGAVISVGNSLVDRTYASDFPVGVGELAPVFVVVPAALPDGMIQSFQTWNQALAGSSPFPSAGNVFHAYVLRPTGVANEYTVMFDSGQLTVPALADPAVGEIATFGVANLAVQAGDVLAFYGQGIPVDTGSGSDVLSFPAPTPPLQDSTITVGSAEYPIYSQPRTYSFGAQVLDMSGENTVVVGGIRKFVDGLAGLGSSGANNLGQYVSVADPMKLPSSNLRSKCTPICRPQNFAGTFSFQQMLYQVLMWLCSILMAVQFLCLMVHRLTGWITPIIWEQPSWRQRTARSGSNSTTCCLLALAVTCSCRSILL